VENAVRILVTGANGCLGRNLREAVPSEWDVTWLNGKRHLDLARPEGVEAALSGDPWDVVIHLAARVDIPGSLTHPDQDMRDNGYVTLNLARYVKCDHFIYLSTGAVYEGQCGLVDPKKTLAPSLPYAIHKLLGESYVRCAVQRFRTARRATIVRFFGAYGPHEPSHKLYHRLARAFAVEHQRAFHAYGDGMNFVDAMWAPDAARALVAIVEGPATEDVRTVDLCRGEPLMVDDVIRVAAETLAGGAVETSYAGFASERNLFYGDPDTLRTSYDWKPTLSLREGFQAYARLLGVQ
jgi:nucleoside-diphosphate-sugar epimerase